jgi:hypothetical protein
MKYLCDLNYDEYDDLVLFQIQDTRESSIIPTENILDIFTEKYGFEYPESFDIVISYGEPSIEVALDISKVPYTATEIEKYITIYLDEHNESNSKLCQYLTF